MRLKSYGLLTEVADLVSISRLKIQEFLDSCSPGEFLLILVVFAWVKLPATQIRLANLLDLRKNKSEALNDFLTQAWKGNCVYATI